MPFRMFHLRILVFIISVFAVKTGLSQESTGFGDFTQEERRLTQCDFDTEAEAVVLLERAESYYDDNYSLITQRRIRIKILKEAGIERGNIHIRFYSGDDFEAIRNIDGRVLNYADNKPVWHTLDRKAIYTKKLNPYYSEVSFALPNIKVGSIFEYTYESRMRHYGGLREWVFQKDIPVVLSSYNLTILPNAEFAYSVYKSSFMPIVVKPNSGNGSVLFEMSNIPGLKEEAYMGAANDYLQRVKFQFAGHSRVKTDGYTTSVESKTSYTNTWGKLAKELLEERDFGSQLTKELPDADAVQAQWSVVSNPYTKMKSIHEYVKSNFSWNGLYSKYADNGLKETWEKKTGTNGAINLILINLLKGAGLQADPLLVSERDHGKIDTLYPYLNQFSNVVAYVTIGDKHYILDGTDKQTPSAMIPFDLLNTTGFIVHKKNPKLLSITDAAKKNFSVISVVGTVTDSGTMQLNTTANYYDYSKIEKKTKYNQDRKRYQDELFASYTRVRLDSFSITGAALDSVPLQQAAQLDYALEKTGNYLLLNYNMFTGFHTNPFTTAQRFSDIDFGCRYTCILNGTFTLPAHLTPEALPKSIKLVMPDGSMSVVRQVQQSGTTIQVGIQVEFLKTVYGPDFYPELQSFFKQMIELLNEPIVLKVKA